MGPPLSTSIILLCLSVVFSSGLVSGLQCYGCNIIAGAKYIDMGCTNPEVITCSQTHKGFKQRFCIKTESVVLGILLTSGCATSRHCQQQELPGVRIHCCDTDLCNNSPHLALHSVLYFCVFFWTMYGLLL
ncbi:Hypothetical predicted protein [Pelobates cultripes]|uniref:Uncharacterized protein n=1 Tax=Pelobates cultripes TaxID=61616 RepID=A0AAD1WQ38_PELCU|nr:Hypothetical predicted protein [Pelobates cultripes]